MLFSGHTSNIKKCVFSDNSNKIMSISEDKTLRVWETLTGQELTSISFNNVPTSIEVSRDGQLVILAQGKCVELYDSSTLNKLHSFTLPSPVSAATIHPDKALFVCGDESFTLYKYCISNGIVLGLNSNNKGSMSCALFKTNKQTHVDKKIIRFRLKHILTYILCYKFRCSL